MKESNVEGEGHLGFERGAVKDRRRIQRRYFLTFKESGNRFLGIDSSILCSLAGRYGSPIPTGFLAPIVWDNFMAGYKKISELL